jgi:hypothetical protein
MNQIVKLSKESATYFNVPIGIYPPPPNSLFFSPLLNHHRHTIFEARLNQQELAATLINKFGTPDEKLVPVNALYALWSMSKLLVELLPQRSAAGTSVLQ